MDIRPVGRVDFFRRSFSGCIALFCVLSACTVWDSSVQLPAVFAGDPCGSIPAFRVFADAGDLSLAVYAASCLNVVFDAGCCQCRSGLQYIPSADYASAGVWTSYTVFVRLIFSPLFKE